MRTISLVGFFSEKGRHENFKRDGLLEKRFVLSTKPLKVLSILHCGVNED